ncbi:C-type lectin domain family 6 member A-like [Pecten maximus]|uniref:C-type lectin domain family 6 member A-like n=1 Tax=Pecten maximus TaxID=6579 RepID=UPI001458FF0D|nr:C-type lectin domain family 6 member A-like [Pecten maximus]
MPITAGSCQFGMPYCTQSVRSQPPNISHSLARTPDTQHVNFYEDKTRSNYVFRDPLFTVVTSSLSKCVALCNIESECYGVSLHISDNSCRGYKRFAGPSTSHGTRVWKKDIRCHPHFTYIKSLDLCWKSYNLLDWNNANRFCSEEDARLIVFDTASKLDSVRQDISEAGETGYYWVGGQYVFGQWEWLDGTKVDMSTTFWGPGEPNDSGDCIGLVMFSHMKFDDGRCTATLRYICEKP